ncbi:hypothetical protein H2200_009958 [Cladophialophora chaetospira]|uniref:AB hydrolase-1 domain-containing protein n=1 Tax=Cladophialophora chaetospira TaxID=386627 RepID=A0AA39CEH0_9EURO|nr:hypothetical protein H2200_009958 [Cladophialophora chaetospira]
MFTPPSSPLPAKRELEPRFSLPATTPRSSRIELVIGGIKVYVYGLNELVRKADVEIAVLYLGHNRKRSYLVTEDIAYEVLHRYRCERRQKRYELIALTMNMRNHGDREVSPQANLTWDDGNDNHGMDLLSMISGSCQDFKLILDYLPTYLPQFTRFHNIIAGVSLGGHTAWRMASLVAPGQIEGYAMVVGCPSLTPLLLSRLGIDEASAHDADMNYDDLVKIMTEEQKRRWPRVLDEMVKRSDKAVAAEFPRDVPVLLCNGVVDPLVPAKYTVAWVDRRKQVDKHDRVHLFIQDNTGHSCTKEMVGLLALWLGDVFQA